MGVYDDSDPYREAKAGVSCRGERLSRTTGYEEVCMAPWRRSSISGRGGPARRETDPDEQRRGRLAGAWTRLPSPCELEPAGDVDGVAPEVERQLARADDAANDRARVDADAERAAGRSQASSRAATSIMASPGRRCAAA